MSLILAAAILAGPPAPPAQPVRPVIAIRVHLGRDKNSLIAASELKNTHPFFNELRAGIERHYRLVVDDEALDFPCYQISAGERLPFRAGSFNGSSCFLLALKSIADLDRWERAEFTPKWRATKDFDSEYFRDTDDKPAEFPPLIHDGPPRQGE